MRALFGGLAVILGAISIALAARYGYKGADTVVDGVISAVVFGAIALCAFLFDAAAVRLWFMRHRLGAVAIGLIAAAALVVTFTNSLGAIAGRDDTTQAQRQNVTDSRADNRRELKRLEDALAKLGSFTPADEETVNAAKRAADTATTTGRLNATSAARCASSARSTRRVRRRRWQIPPQPRRPPTGRRSWRRTSARSRRSWRLTRLWAMPTRSAMRWPS